MRKVVMVGLAAVAASVLGVAGIASASGATRHGSDDPGSRTSTSAQSGTGTGTGAQTGISAAVSQADAERIALAKVPGGRVTEAYLSREHGAIVWSVHVASASGSTEVYVDAQTGTARLDDHGDHGSVDDRGGHGSDDGAGHR